MWQAIAEIIETILYYAKIAWQIIGYLNTINALNRPGGAEAFVQAIIRSYLIGIIANIVERTSSDSPSAEAASTATGVGVVEELGQLVLDSLNPIRIFRPLFT